MDFSKNILAGGLVAWLLLATVFIARSPAGAFNHDAKGHIEHTQILYRQHRLALPREGWETYQPPFYYLVNTLFSPNNPSHTFRVRLMSVLYGCVTLLLMGRLLTRFNAPPSAQVLVLFFIATTPAFLFMFTTYNNDSLATLLSVGILVMADQWIEKGRLSTMIQMGILMTAGLYTKLSVAYLMTALVIIVGYLAWSGRIVTNRFISLLAAAIISVLLLTPWLIGHNYRLTGELTPIPADFPLYEQVRLPHSPLKTLLTPPGWSHGEWKDPYAHVWEPVNHKKNSFLAYLFVTSIFGEYTFEFLPPSIPWAIIVLHAFIWIVALTMMWQSVAGKLAFSFLAIGIVSLASLILRAPYAVLMDFRYIAWVWLPIAILYTAGLRSSTAASSRRAAVFRAAMISGTLLQGLVWLALIIGGRWNIPL